MAVATTAASGGDDGSRVRAGGEPEEGEEHGERLRGPKGARGVSRATSGRRQHAGGGQARRRRSPPSCFVRWQGEEDKCAPGGLGQLAGLPAGPARWAAGEVTLSLSLLI